MSTSSHYSDSGVINRKGGKMVLDRVQFVRVYTGNLRSLNLGEVLK